MKYAAQAKQLRNEINALDYALKNTADPAKVRELKEKIREAEFKLTEE